MVTEKLGEEEGSDDGTEYDVTESDIEAVDHVALMASTRSFPESIYGAAMVAFVRTIGTNHKFHKATVSVILILFLNLALQGYVLYAVKIYVCAPTVMQARQLYLEFEQANFNPITRQFNQTMFDNWDPRAKAKLCNLPLSQPFFFMVVLSIWTCQVMTDITETITYIHYWCQLPNPESEENHVDLQVSSNDNEVQLMGADRCTKAMVMLFILIPKGIISVFLWWLGARWLTATTSFQDVLINVVALAFINELDEVMYHAFLPVGYKHKVQLYTISVEKSVQSQMSPVVKKHANTWSILFKLALCMVIPVVYVSYFQQVLPHYHWDVAVPCETVFDRLLEQEAQPPSTIVNVTSYIVTDEDANRGGKAGRR